MGKGYVKDGEGKWHFLPCTAWYRLSRPEEVILESPDGPPGRSKYIYMVADSNGSFREWYRSRRSAEAQKRPNGAIWEAYVVDWKGLMRKSPKVMVYQMLRHVVMLRRL